MTVAYSTQYIGADNRDITPDFYAEDDAKTVRYWQGDFVLMELTKVDGGWQPTGGDSGPNGGWVLLADQVFDEPYLALAELYSGGRKANGVA